MERIKLYDDTKQKSDELQSSWIWDITWDDGVVIRRYEDIYENGEKIRRITPMKYDEVSYEIFEKIKNSESKGSVVNRYIIQNKDVDQARISDSTQDIVLS